MSNVYISMNTHMIRWCNFYSTNVGDDTGVSFMNYVILCEYVSNTDLTVYRTDS